MDFSFRFFDQNFVHISHLPVCITFLAHLILLHLIISTVFVFSLLSSVPFFISFSVYLIFFTALLQRFFIVFKHIETHLLSWCLKMFVEVVVVAAAIWQSFLHLL
jgi:hypothetical protein